MVKKRSKLQVAKKKAEVAEKKTNQKINELGRYTSDIYASLTAIQTLFNHIRNVPEEKRLKYESLKATCVNWKQQVEKIELECKKAEVKAVIQGAVGVGAGAVIVARGSTDAMGIATTFGAASYETAGTAIFSLSGTATNASLTCLGSGALFAGGGGVAGSSALFAGGGSIATSSAFSALTGPIGWTIVGLSVVISGLNFFKTKSDKERLENIYTLISNRDVKSYELAIVELSERIKRIVDENGKLEEAIAKIETFGTDYSQMTEEQQYELGAYVNLMEAATMLLVNPILGLQPKFSKQDFDKVCAVEREIFKKYFQTHRNMIISMANLLFKVTLDDKDRKILAKFLRENKAFLESIQMTKKEFGADDIFMVERALNHRYKFRAD